LFETFEEGVEGAGVDLGASEDFESVEGFGSVVGQVAQEGET
jgi:hypothetical protein